jgi:hypothetical protein
MLVRSPVIKAVPALAPRQQEKPSFDCKVNIHFSGEHPRMLQTLYRIMVYNLC